MRRKTAIIVAALVATATPSFSINVTLTGKDGFGSTSFNTAGKWSNLAAPVSTNDYSTAGFSLRTPPNSSSHVFAGASLTVLPTTDGDTGIIFKGTGSGVITVNKLTLAGGRGLGNGSSPTTQTLAGNIAVTADTGIDPGQNATFHIAANITNGTAALYLANVSTTLGTLMLSGSNSAWTGKLIATNLDAARIYRVVIGSEQNLGGNPSSFAADHLQLSSAIFVPTNSFAINSPNRGITLGTFGGTFSNASGINLTVLPPITGPGSLTQSGAGALIFLGTNNYTGSTFVQSGSLVLSNSGAISGSASVVISSGAALNVVGRTDGRFMAGAGRTLQGEGTLVGNLAFDPAANFQYQTQSGATTNGALLVQGDLTLDGTLQLTGVGSLPSGIYTFPLLRYTGSLTNNGLLLGAVPPTFVGSIVIDSGNKLVNLVATNTAIGSTWLLSATPNNSRATLAWSPMAGATNYQIRRAVSAVGPFTNILNLTTTNYTDAPLLNGQTYFYFVGAISNTVEFSNTSVASVTPFIAAGTPAMMYGDSARLNRPFAKDPTVIRFSGRYLMYYSQASGKGLGWSVGIAQSSDLVNWMKVGDFIQGTTGPDKNGLAAPCGKVINDQVHMFYQSYTGSASDRICHAVSTNGIDFVRNPANPIFGPVGSGVWNNGRAIDADYIEFNGKMWLSCATRNTANSTQQVVVAVADIGTNYSSSVWAQINPAAPSFPPVLPWEGECIEGQTMCVRSNQLFMFYGADFNNNPQQIGVAVSSDGTNWTRNPAPFFADGAAGTWNSSESGHPGVFVDDDGQTYLFFQGNNDNGNTWYLSVLKLDWNVTGPFIKPGIGKISDASVSLGTSKSSTVALMYPVPTVNTLTLSAISTNTSLLPSSNLIFSGSGAGRTLTVTPVAANAGMSRITVTATDTNGISDSQSFLLAVGTPQERWRHTWFGNPFNSGAGADTNSVAGDGVPNLMKFAFGLNPTWPATNGLPAASWDGSYLALQYRQRSGGSGIVGVDYSADGLTYVVQVADSLLNPNWSSGTNLLQWLGDRADNGDGTETVTVKLIQPANASSKFVRLAVFQ